MRREEKKSYGSFANLRVGAAYGILSHIEIRPEVRELMKTDEGFREFMRQSKAGYFAERAKVREDQP
jgi:hypothetical protein